MIHLETVVTHSIYNATTGLFTGVVLSVPLKALHLNIPEGHASVEGVYDHLSEQVDVATSTVIEYTPPAPTPNHEWNAMTKRWQLTAIAAANAQAKHAARERIAVLETMQHGYMRRMLLGRLGDAQKLQAIDDEISELEKLL